MYHRMAGSIPGESTYLGCGLNPQSGHVLIGVSLSLSLFLPFFKFNLKFF